MSLNELFDILGLDVRNTKARTGSQFRLPFGYVPILLESVKLYSLKYIFCLFCQLHKNLKNERMFSSHESWCHLTQEIDSWYLEAGRIHQSTWDYSWSNKIRDDDWNVWFPVSVSGSALGKFHFRFERISPKDTELHSRETHFRDF